jgi:hypothetical protein
MRSQYLSALFNNKYRIPCGISIFNNYIFLHSFGTELTASQLIISSNTGASGKGHTRIYFNMKKNYGGGGMRG